MHARWHKARPPRVKKKKKKNPFRFKRFSLFISCLQNNVGGYKRNAWYNFEHSSGAVWESRWTSWAVRPNEPSGLMSRFIICEGQSHKTLSTFMSCKRSRIKLSSDWSGLGWGCLLFFCVFFFVFLLFFLLLFLTGSCHWCARFRLKLQALVYDILLPKAMLEVWLWLRVLYPQGTEDKKSSLSLGYQGKDNSSWISSLVLCGATQVKLKS